jgi:hypothetical protein
MKRLSRRSMLFFFSVAAMTSSTSNEERSREKKGDRVGEVSLIALDQNLQRSLIDGKRLDSG